MIAAIVQITGIIATLLAKVIRISVSTLAESAKEKDRKKKKRRKITGNEH